MARRGDLYENRVTGERAVVLRGDLDGRGQSGLVHLAVAPGGAVVGEHVHPAIDERFKVVSGELGTRIAGVARRLGPGEEALAPAGTPHDWWNAGGVPASVIVELSPGSGLARFEVMIATLFGLANSGRANAKGLPSPLQLALTAAEFSDVIQMTKPRPSSSAPPSRCLARSGVGAAFGPPTPSCSHPTAPSSPTPRSSPPPA
jgi:mannose-6-phosphate isomerase-like protein (cupin superfamily)